MQPGGDAPSLPSKVTAISVEPSNSPETALASCRPQSIKKECAELKMLHCNRPLARIAPAKGVKELSYTAPFPQRTRPSILVVDDEYLYLELISDTLNGEYDLLFANDGKEAMELAAAKMPDLILLDVMMPGIDGYETQSRLRQDPRTSQIPVIFITGLGDSEAETRGLKLGAVDYITKPINPEPVRARVNTQIQLKLTRDRLTRMAMTDGLTGLANRSYFDTMLAYENARHARSGSEFSLILLDIDRFKSFNDTYGHVSGDHCLQNVARAITDVAVRATDIVARYGGEEFVLLLPETPLDGALILAEKVRQSISALSIPHEQASTQYVTASLGVASSSPLPGNRILDIVKEADRQLYIAKAGGRNQVAPRISGSTVVHAPGSGCENRHERA